MISFIVLACVEESDKTSIVISTDIAIIFVDAPVTVVVIAIVILVIVIYGLPPMPPSSRGMVWVVQRVT